jgi:hypothetical protein
MQQAQLYYLCTKTVSEVRCGSENQDWSITYVCLSIL